MTGPNPDDRLILPNLIPLEPGLILRALTPSDAPVVFAAVDQARPHLRRWLPWVDATREVADTRHFLEETEELRAEGLRYAYGIWRHGQLCGVIGTHDLDTINRSISIGYWLRPGEQGKGLMTRACAALIATAFEVLHLERIDIRVAAGNDRSAAVPLRLGFQLDGVLRHAQLLSHGWADMRVYSLLRHEFELNRAATAPLPVR